MIESFFKKLNLREKFLLLGLTWVGLLIWASFLWQGISQKGHEVSQAAQTLAIQKKWLMNEAAIELNLKTAMTKMNPQKTYSKNKFIGRVDEMARKSGLRHDASNPETHLNGIFKEHTLTLQLKEASLKQLLVFDALLAKETPYIGLYSLKLVPERQNPYTLSAEWNLLALELSKLPEIKSAKNN